MAHGGGGSVLGTFDGVLFIRNFLSLRNDYLLLSHKSLRIEVNSTLERVLPNTTREIYFATLEGAASMPWTHGVSIYDIEFTWDLVDDLDSRRSFYDDFCPTEGCLMLSIY